MIAGETKHPAVGTVVRSVELREARSRSYKDVSDFPPPREDPGVAAQDWASVRECIDNGGNSGIVFDPDLIGEAIDVIQNRVGFNTVIRVVEPGLIQICRPESLRWGDEDSDE